ncbi:MAG: O-antigen ligase family protein [Cryomorphaceae bacterium]|nr:O-antigen ligase family protein [Cryomorphaceae bacterium]
MRDQKTISIALLGVFFSVVFLVYTPTYPDPSLGIKWMVITLFGAILTFIFRRELSMISFAWLGILLWLIWQFILIPGSVNGPEALSVAWKYAGISALGLAISSWWRNRGIALDKLSRVMSLAFIIVLISALFAMLKYGLPRGFFDNLYKMQGLGGHKNMLTMLLFVGMAFFVFSSKYDSSKGLRNLFKTAAILALICIVVLRTRSLWIALVFSGGISLLLLAIKEKKLSAKIWIPGVIVPLILAGFYFFNVSEAGDATNLSHRAAFWQKSMGMWNEYPNGVGPGMWKIHLPAQGLEGVNHAMEQGRTQILRPHNDYLWILTESGWIGAIGFFGFLLIILYYAIRSLRKNDSNIEHHFKIAMFFVFVGYLIFMFFDFPMERPEHLFLLFFISGFFLRDSKAFWVSKKIRPVFLFVLLGLMLFSTFVATHRLQGDGNLKEVIAAHGQKNPGKLIMAVNQTLNPYYNLDRVANSLYYYRGLAEFAQKKLPEAFEDFNTGLTLTPYNIVTMNQLASWYKMCNDNLKPKEKALLIKQIDELDASTDFLKASEELYERAISISPHYTDALLGLAELHLRKGDFHGALRSINAVYPVDYSSPKFVQITEGALRMWYQAPPADRRRPKLVAYFAKNDPEMKNPVKTYTDYLQQR